MKSLKVLKEFLDYDHVKISPKTIKTRGPYKLARARTLGYKNTPEFVSYVSSIKKGGIDARPTKKGRKPMNQCRKYSRDISHKQRVVDKVSRNKSNLKLVGVYLIKKDKVRKYYELIYKVRKPTIGNLKLSRELLLQQQKPQSETTKNGKI